LDEQYFCTTVFGYGGSSFANNSKFENEKGSFIIENSEWSTKGETDIEYG
jgi:hypothetical protein